MNVSTDSLQAAPQLVLVGTREEVHVSEPETIDYQGVDIRVEYVFQEYDHIGGVSTGRVKAILYVEQCDVDKLRIPYGLFTPLDMFGLKSAGIDRWVATEDGNELYSAQYFHGLKYAQRRWRRERAQTSYQERLKELRQESSRLQRLGRPTDTLEYFIQEAGLKVRFFNEGWRRGSDNTGVAEALRAVENEIARITGGGTELLVDDLMDGKIHHKDVARNQWVIDQVKVWSIRTGGEIAMITPEGLREFYLKRLDGVTRVDMMQAANLALNLDEYVPVGTISDMIEEGIIECAPESIEIQGRKKPVSYPVTYDLYEVDGEPVPVGVIAIPLAVYERNAAEYGKKSGFTELPHGIRLFIHVTVDDKEIARGFDDEHLAKSITKYKRSKSRGKAIAGVGIDELNYRRYSPIAPSEVPPWYQGARPRW